MSDMEREVGNQLASALPGIPVYDSAGTRLPSLTDFLLARIAEDEAGEIQHETVLDGYLGGERKTLVRHTRVEPSPRWLAECAAKRRIVELFSWVDEVRTSDPNDTHEDRWYDGDATLRALALPYADHPDYRAEWAL